MTNPLLSIGLPVYNGGAALASAIADLLGQDLADLELLIFDNASTDETVDICRAASAGDARVRYHRNERNVGAVANFRLALKHATGRYFMWAAHDDRWSRGYARALVERLEAHPDAVLAAGRAEFPPAPGERQTASLFFDAPRADVAPWITLLRQHATHWMYGVFRTEEFKTLDEELWSHDPWGGDTAFLLALAARGKVIGSDGALIVKVQKPVDRPSPFRPRGLRAVLRSLRWFGGALFAATRGAPLGVAARARLRWEVLRLLEQQVVSALWSSGALRPARGLLAAARQRLARSRRG